MLPQYGADGRGLFRAGTMFQRVAGRGAHRRQVAGAHSLFLGFAVGVDGAAHRIVAGKGFRRRDADAGHGHDEPACRAGRQGFHQVADAAHAAGAAQQGKRHVGPDARAEGAEFAHRKAGVVQVVEPHQHAGRVGAAAGHAGTHRHPLVDRHIDAGQQPRVVEKRQRRLDGGVFVVDRHKAAGQRQAQPLAAAQRDLLVQIDGLHDHIEVMVAVGQRADDVQRKVELGRGQHGDGTFLHRVLPFWSVLIAVRLSASRFPAKRRGCGASRSAGGRRCRRS